MGPRLSAFQPTPPTTVDNSAQLAGLALLAVMLAMAVYMELRERRIPNWLTFSGMALGMLIGYLHGRFWFWSSLGGLTMGFGFFFIFYVFGGVGGGDVKLMGAAGALMGVDLIKPALFYTTMFGAFLGVMMVVWRKDFWARIGRELKRVAFWQKSAAADPPPTTPIIVPYGLAIAAGCLAALLAKGAGL